MSAPVPTPADPRSAVVPPLVWIVVLNWHNAPDTIACVDSLLRMTERRWRLVVCDNASTDGSAEVIETALRERFPTLTVLDEPAVARTLPTGQAYLVRNAANHGYAGGNNVGLDLALRDPAMTHVWVLNNDTEVDAGALGAVLDHAARHPDQGIIGATLVYHADGDRMQAAGGARYNRWTGMVELVGHGVSRARAAEFAHDRFDFIVGAAMLITRPYLERVGTMDASFFLYLEEIDYCRRGRRWFRLGYAPAAIVYHKEGGSTGGKREAVSHLADFYNIRNRLRVTWRHFPYAMPTVMAGLAMTVLNRLRRGQADRVPMVLKTALRFQTIDYADVRPPTAGEDVTPAERR